MSKERLHISKFNKSPLPATRPAWEHRTPISGNALTALHHHLGNRAIQRLLQRQIAAGESGATELDETIAARINREPMELDPSIAARINRERQSGEPLNETVQASLEQAIGADLSGVRVHTSPEAHTLNQQLGARAFTSGRDIFFRQGAYDPGSTGGQALLAHELTHVAQQHGTLSPANAARMTLSSPDDAYEQEADAVAAAIAQQPPELLQPQMEQDEQELQDQEAL